MAVAYHTHTFNVQEATDEQAAAGLSREVFLVPANLPPLLAEKQGLNDALTSIAGLTTSADQMIYTTGADAYATTALTAYGRSIVGSIDASALLTLLGAGTTGTALFQDETAADARTTLELGSLATLSTISNTNWSGADLAIENGGTGASSADVARTNLGLGTVATQDGTAVPAGGTTGQVLAKASATDGDTFWTIAGQGDLISTNNGSDFANPLAVPANIGAMPVATYDPNTVAGDAFDSTNHVFNEGGTGAVDVSASALFGDQLASRMFGVVGDGVADDTLAVQAFIDRCIATGKRGILMGIARVTGDLNVSGDLDLYGVLNSRIVADGANVVKLDGTLAGATIKFENVGFRDFARSALWIEEGAQIAFLSVDGCDFRGNRVALSAQGDTSRGDYLVDRYHIPNPNTKISRLDFVGGTNVEQGGCGIGLSCIVSNANVSGNIFHDLTNDNIDGGSLDHAVHAVRILLDGLAKEVSGKYSDFYDEQQNIIVSQNRIYSLAQNVASKNINAVNVSGFGVVITGNVIRNVDGTSADDGEGIYAKAAECVIVGNTLYNAGGDQAAINVKGLDINAEDDPASQTSNPGRSRIVGFNNVLFENTPAGYICTAVNIEVSPCLVIGNIFRGITNNGVVISGPEIAAEFEDIQIIGNRFEGTHSNAVALRGGIKGLQVHDNVNAIYGGDGNCSFFEISTNRTGTISDVSLKGNKHRVRDRTGATGYNAFARMAGSVDEPNVVIDGLVIEGNVADHFISGMANYGIFAQTPIDSIRGLVIRNNEWPEDLPFGSLTSLPNIDLEYLIDDRIITTTTSGTGNNVLNTRVPDNSKALIEVIADGVDLTTGEVAHYHKKALFKRVGTTTTQIGADITVAELEEDTTWGVNPNVVGSSGVVTITGDAVNSVRWDVRLKVSVDTYA